ncbi:MAG: flagellar motor switch protein FliN [Planctomycetes bacterium]|nr:flagellar motor switch protein FliN [Planctomycetota bacterium]
MERVDGDLASEMAAAIADEAEAGAGVAEAAEEGQDLAAEMEAALAAEAAAASDATHAAQGGQDLAAEMEAAIAAAESQRAAEASEPEGPVAIGGRPGPDPPAAAQGYKAPDFALTDGGADLGSIELLDDVELDVRIELGRTEMYIEDVLKLAVGSVIELDKLAGDPVDIFVNERLIARGEVLVLNESFCVRINDILSPIPELAED